ncbi:flagellar hook-basal body complex protein FliE [Ralstonia sp. 22111]|uniref:flagellar hook-basal body complex protein FliE n=1 Tax=Ralstonia TaxID=48736 RepID=UPI003D99C45F
MMTDAIQAIAQAGNGEAVADLQPSPVAMVPAVGTGFGDLVSHGLAGVNQQLLVSQKDLQQLATGNVENLHQVMIRLEESRLSFQLLLQVRNRLLEAYQDVMKMQV